MFVVADSVTLIGVPDGHDYLPPGHVFSQWRAYCRELTCTEMTSLVAIKEKGQPAEYVQGRVLVTRSPQTHPGTNLPMTKIAGDLYWPLYYRRRPVCDCHRAASAWFSIHSG